LRLKSTQLIPSPQGVEGQAGQWASRLVRFLDNTFRQIAQIPFSRAEAIETTITVGADTDFTLTHHLGRTPSGFIVTSIDRAGIIYADSSTWTDTEITLKCSLDSSVTNTSLTVYVF